jgi:hypothetical protein
MGKPEKQAAWKILRAVQEIEDRAGEGTMATAVRPRKKVIKIKLVVAASEMDSETFARHFTHRHADSLAGQETLPDDITFEVEQMYRAFHFRLHGTRPRAELGHEHETENRADAIDHAIYCLIENHNWGWKELAGVTGKHVAVFPPSDRFPNGDIAVRVNGVVTHHKTIESATDHLLGV